MKIELLNLRGLKYSCDNDLFKGYITQNEAINTLFKQHVMKNLHLYYVSIHTKFYKVKFLIKTISKKSGFEIEM